MALNMDTSIPNMALPKRYTKESCYPILLVGMNNFCTFAKVMTVTVITNTILDMKFYDRGNERQVLGEVLQQSRREARMTVLMGRRRIGKTELSQRCGDDTFREKVDKVLEQTPELRKMTIHVGSLSLEDM